MARNSELKLDADTSKAMDAMRNETPIEEVVQEAPVMVEDEQLAVEQPKEETEATSEQPVTESKTVPLAALQETREALKEEKRRNEEMQKRTDERLRLLTEALTKQIPVEEQKQQPIVIPDPEKDALGSLKAMQRQIQEQAEFQRQQHFQQQEQTQRQQIMQRAAQLESEFVAVTPDYNSASQFLMQSRHGELTASKMYTPQQVNDILRSEAQALAHQAIQAGNNPAEIVYNIAKARGYAKAEAKVAVKQGETEEQKMSRIQAGQAASKSLGQANGAQLSSGAKLDGKTLANMSDEEFGKLYNKLSRGERAALMGN